MKRMGNVQSRMCLFTLVIGLTFGQGNSELVKRAVESNDPLDQFLAGSWYMMSGLGKEVAGAKGINRDYLEARRWFEKAAEGGSVEAQYNLGLMYQLGKGMPIQLEKAAHWFLKAAKNGHLNAQLEMARAYHGGIGVQKSDEDGLVWLTLTGERNVATSQYLVGK